MKSDSAVSVVVAFVIILAVISVIVGVWALFGIPGQLHAAGEAAVSESESAFTDYKIKLEALQNSDTRMVNLSVLMPMGGAASSGTLRVEKAGGLGVINDTESLSSDYLTGGAKLIEIHRLVSDVGLRGTQVGFEANGIFRNDNGMASWSVPLNLTLWNDTGSPGGQLYVRLNAATITGSLDVGGTGSIPLNTYYTGDNVTVNTTNRTQSLVYATENEWDANLWYSQFYEALEEFKAGNKFPTNTTAEISRSSLSGLHLVWMNITTLNGGEEMHTLEVHTPVYNAQAVEGYIVVAPAYHIIQASAGENGTISPSGSVRVREGSTQTFTITPDSGYTVKEVIVNGTTTIRGSDLTPFKRGKTVVYLFENVMKDGQTIYANFEEAAQYDITVTVEGGAGGTIILPNGGGGSY